MSHIAPGGGAVGAEAAIERLNRFGISGPAAAASVALTGPVSLTTIAAVGAIGMAIAFGVAQILSAIPLTPGAVGIFESGMAGVFTLLGVSFGLATTLAITYRIFETWLPTLAGVPVVLRPVAGGGTPTPTVTAGMGRRVRTDDEAQEADYDGPVEGEISGSSRVMLDEETCPARVPRKGETGSTRA